MSFFEAVFYGSSENAGSAAPEAARWHKVMHRSDRQNTPFALAKIDRRFRMTDLRQRDKVVSN
jgi:hypothetical protein